MITKGNRGMARGLLGLRVDMSDRLSNGGSPFHGKVFRTRRLGSGKGHCFLGGGVTSGELQVC